MSGLLGGGVYVPVSVAASGTAYRLRSRVACPCGGEDIKRSKLFAPRFKETCRTGWNWVGVSWLDDVLTFGNQISFLEVKNMPIIPFHDY